MGTPILATVDWPFLILAAFGILQWISWCKYRRMIRDINIAGASGDVARSIEGMLRLHRSWSPWAVVHRIRRPGDNEADLAVNHVNLGEVEDGLRWCDRGLPVARTPISRPLLLAARAEAYAAAGDLPALDCCLEEFENAYADGQFLGLSWHVLAAECYCQCGKPEQAIALLAEHAHAGAKGVSAAYAGVLCATLAALGRSDEIFRVADRLADSLSSDPLPLLDEHASSRNDGTALDQLRSAQRRMAESFPIVVALSAAGDAGRWDLYGRYLETLAPLAQGHLRLRASVLGYQAIRSAHIGAEHAAKSKLEELDELLRTIPRDLRQKVDSGILIAYALRLLGRDELALAHLSSLSESSPTPLRRSLIAARIAECLDALGRGAEAERHREEAQLLAPHAWWNHPERDAELDEKAVVVLNAWSQAPSGRPSSIEEATPQEPVEPVASRLAWAVWILAILAMFPASGALAALPLLACAVVLITRRDRRMHDRRVGWAGIILATLSIASAAFLVHAHRVGFERLSAMAAVSWADDPSLPALTPTNDTAPKPTTTQEPQQASDPADEDDEFQAVDSVPDVRSGPNWSYSTSAVWQLKVLFLVVLILSIIPHEVGHGVAALWCGDPTARDQRRLSLNPLRHVSWLGSVFIPLLLILMPGCSVWVGWAKPVPIQPQRFRARRWGQIAVSLSGVSMNLLLAGIAANVLTVTLAIAEIWYHGGLATSLFDAGTLTDVANVPSPAVWGWIVDVSRVLLLVNAVLVVFNLIPLPPLDGFLLFRSVVPSAIGNLLSRLSLLGFAVFIVLVATGMIAWLAMPAVYLVTPLLLPAYLLGLL